MFRQGRARRRAIGGTAPVRVRALAHADEAGGLPRFVAHELRAFLRCGRAEFGFARFRCHACRQDRLVAFSSKTSGVCPSCGGRRMADLAAWLCDRVLPAVPIRQWVPSLPYDVRALLAYDPEVCRAVRTVFVHAVSSWIERRAGDAGHPGGRTGAVVFVQRFDAALQLDVHFHALVLDGVFCREGPLVAPVFRRIPAADRRRHRAADQEPRSSHRPLSRQARSRPRRPRAVAAHRRLRRRRAGHAAVRGPAGHARTEARRGRGLSPTRTLAAVGFVPRRLVAGRHHGRQPRPRRP